MDLTLFKNQVICGIVPVNLSEKQAAIIEQKTNMLNDQNVRSKLTSVEFEVAEAGTKLPIKFMQESELVDKVKVMAKFIARDVGLMHWDNDSMKYDYTRFYTMLKTYYHDMTIEQIKKAFELGMVGMLDDYLPKDREGNPDNNHYQRFSVEYYTKILNAFRRKNGDIWGKVRMALPKLELQLSEDEKKMNHQLMLNDIFEAYINYQKGKSPEFIFSMYINYFIEQGHIKEIPKPKQEEFQKAKTILLLSNHTPKEEKKQLRENYSWALKNSAALKNEAQILANNRLIKLVFDDWIKRGFELINTEEK